VAETKPKESPSLRQPKAKKSLGLTVPPALRMPHDDLIQGEPSMPSQTTMTSLTRHTPEIEPSQPVAAPVSPERDFSKVANSIRREAVPAGLFKGKSKQLYDVLYGLTRGAVAPKRKVRVPRPRLMKLAHIGARNTFEANVEHLRAVGLVAVKVLAGEHEGNEYEVFIPEELSMPSQTSQSSLTRHAQKLDRLVSLETSLTRHTSSVEDTTTYGESKTSFKTNTENDDDEAFAPLLARFRTAVKEVTGREPASADAERWDQLAELLITELKIAAGRTTVSNVPAFLTEHLRRRLWKKEKRQLEAEAASGRGLESAPAVIGDVSKCPDCYGTGMWYPEGFDKGVARCGHEKLRPEGGD
jgi:hypothetical protein